MSKTDLETLARWRALGARHSEEVIELAQRVLVLDGTTSNSNLGDQEWAIREQLAIAALDLGKSKLANQQISLLHGQFKSSPRVKILDGLALEVKGDVGAARGVYEGLLEEDGTNVSAHQRLIALSLSSAAPAQTIILLLSYLDTFYSDPAGWSLLSDLYAEQGLYAQALNALGHMALVAPFDEGAVRRMGEVAYTMGDYQLALKHFLRATEMEGGPEDLNKAGKKRTRSWWGVKLATSRLLDPSLASTDSTVPPESRSTTRQLEALELLAVERLVDAGGKGMQVRRRVLGGQGGVPLR